MQLSIFSSYLVNNFITRPRFRSVNHESKCFEKRYFNINNITHTLIVFDLSWTFVISGTCSSLIKRTGTSLIFVYVFSISLVSENLANDIANTIHKY